MEERLSNFSGTAPERRPPLGRIPSVAICLLLCSAVVGAMTIAPASDRAAGPRFEKSPSLALTLPIHPLLASPVMQAVRIERVAGSLESDALPILAAARFNADESRTVPESSELLHALPDSAPVPMEPIADRPLFPILPSAPVLRTLMMEVTAYCACPRCCGPRARGITASGRSVDYNNGLFVAADTSILPFGTRLQIPGYAESGPVEVIDRGGAIKGNRLDVFFPTHAQAKEWGRRWIAVDVLD